MNPAGVTAMKAEGTAAMYVPLYYMRASGEFTYLWLSYNIKHVAKPHCRNSVPADAFIRPASVREKPSQRG